ncbi:hypothetical protein B0H16DRAFT_1475159 [Mycena metata]|uniref:DUF6532 domain-containing protein n=1 Tax=Mycena metata TaxID=1033252 RepID=A0AAD7HEV8_9AGAR|nr:hypothetical protein B0H16DRAFT_1475159 [Mycena metata]
MRTTSSQDALIRAARDLKLLAIQNRLPQDLDYRSGLSTVLLGRVSIWRGKVKAAALQIAFGHYSVQHDCAALVARLLDKQALIYPFKPDKRDLKTNEIVYGKPDNKRPYEHKGFPAVVSCFFKGPNSIAERVEAMFVRNSAGNLEASKSIVALACTGIWGVLDDYATGEHKPTDFDGSRVQDVYDVHIMLLERLEAKNAEQYRTLMEDIFNTASRGSQFAKGVKVPTVQQQEALSMLDWSD